MDGIVGGTKASLMAAFSSRLLFHPLLTVHGSLTFIGDATVVVSAMADGYRLIGVN